MDASWKLAANWFWNSGELLSGVISRNPKRPTCQKFTRNLKFRCPKNCLICFKEAERLKNNFYKYFINVTSMLVWELTSKAKVVNLSALCWWSYHQVVLGDTASILLSWCSNKKILTWHEYVIQKVSLQSKIESTVDEVFH